MPVTYPKNRWAWVEVSLAAIRKNTRAFKALSGNLACLQNRAKLVS